MFISAIMIHRPNEIKNIDTFKENIENYYLRMSLNVRYDEKMLQNFCKFKLPNIKGFEINNIPEKSEYLRFFLSNWFPDKVDFCWFNLFTSSFINEFEYYADAVNIWAKSVVERIEINYHYTFVLSSCKTKVESITPRGIDKVYKVFCWVLLYWIKIKSWPLNNL